MNKTVRILLALGLLLAFAAPAFAEVKIMGNYRLMSYSNELKDTDYKNGDSQQWIDQRLRIGLVNTLNDNVAITYYAEIDSPWGDSANGGAFDGDGFNVQSKWIYLDVKSGDTSARIGLQSYADEFEGLLVNADMTGAAVKHKIGNTSLGFLYAKWDENDGDGDSAAGTADTSVTTAGRSDWDDTDFYGVTVSQKFSDTFKAGAAVYFLDINDATDPRPNISTTAGNNGLGEWSNPTPSILTEVGAGDRADAEIFFYGLTAAATFGDFSVDGFALLQDGKLKVEGEDCDSSALAASIKGKMKLANGDIGLRAIYISDDDNDDDNDYWTGGFGEYEFVNENQMLFLIDKFTQNATKEHYAIQDAAREGYGLMAFVLSGNHTLPEGMYLNWGAGYYSALSDDRNDEAADSREGKTLGYELCARVGKKFFEKVDVSVNGAFADFGSFYDEKFQDDDMGAADEDPDSIYKVYLMVNVPF